ncbi:hypothetical protein ACCP16_14195 [Xanthomonas citri pv. malvacearum]|uniref:hypothetical protein n=1 Tax=Xanthomonas TaxID=338 RepID=UPI0002F0EC28|nr:MULTISPECIES: hypothetical protein [Xanthomonas]
MVYLRRPQRGRLRPVLGQRQHPGEPAAADPGGAGGVAASSYWDREVRPAKRYN